MYDQHQWLSERNFIPDRSSAEAAARVREAAATLGADAETVEASWQLAAQAEVMRRQAWEQSQVQPARANTVDSGVKTPSSPSVEPEKIEKFLGGVHVINPPPRKVEQVPPLPEKYRPKPDQSRNDNYAALETCIIIGAWVVAAILFCILCYQLFFA